ncbi:hypothetical protein B0O99DRAFT_273489 [Bisporella sp. PMI_857]|nr:hypothetical protein B0O99DRAFT_273489 [Bisporella sp. PMI_857]
MDPPSPVPEPKPESATAEAAQVKWAGARDWEKMKPLIKQLYVDEDKTLKDVTAIMAEKYNFRATKKMYASRFTKWGWDKNKKEEDMVFILQKTAERAREGKKTTFVVRGRVISEQEVRKYFARKGGRSSQKWKAERKMLSYRPVTPPNVSYRTPSPIPPDDEQDDDERLRASSEAVTLKFESTDVISTHSRTVSPAVYTSNSTLSAVEPTAIPAGYTLSYVSVKELQRIQSHAEISPEPARPQIYRISEELFHSVKSYHDASFQNRIWVYSTQSKDYCNAARGVDRSRAHGRFLDACGTSIELIKQQKFADARSMLSQACELIPTMLRSGNPRSVSAFMENYMRLVRENFPEVTNIIRNHTSDMVTAILPRGHPLYKICNLMAALDYSDLEEAITQAWRCINEAFVRNIGQFAETTLHSYLTYLRFVQRSIDPLAEEAILRKLLADSEKVLNESDPASLIIRFKIGTNLREQKRWAQCEIEALELLDRVRELAPFMEDVIVFQNLVQGYGLAAYAEYELAKEDPAKQDLAERNMIDAADVVAGRWGRTDPHVMRKKMTLEGWLREWGKVEKADALRVEIEQLTEEIRRND